MLENILPALNNPKTINRTLFAFSLLIVAYYLSPLVLTGEDLIIRIHDNLDSAHAKYVVLANSGAMFADSMELIPNILHGLPRLSFGSEFFVLPWLYVLFEPFSAYTVNEAMMHIIAYFGMVVLLKRYFIAEDDYKSSLLVHISALMFALLPFWPPGGLSVAGQPLALYAFLNIRQKRDTFYDWLILALIPFYSSFVLAFVFFLSILFFMFVFDSLNTGKLNYKFLLAIILMTTIYLIIENRLISLMLFDPDYISHRSAFRMHLKDFMASYKFMHLNFLDGHIQTENMQFLVVIYIVLIGLILAQLKQEFSTPTSILFSVIAITVYTAGIYHSLMVSKYAMVVLIGISLLFLYLRKNSLFNILFFFLLLSSLLFALRENQIMLYIYDLIPPVKTFNFGRFYFLQSLVWYLLTALSMFYVIKYIKYSIPLLIIVFFIQLNHLFIHRSFTYSYTGTHVSYREFYSENQFREIKKYLDGLSGENYFIATLGLAPSILQLNGFQTVGGYVSNYPLERKLEFQEAMIRELDKNVNIKNYFIDWGNDCRLYSVEIGPTLSLARSGTINQLDINMTAVRSMGAKFLLTQYNIENAESIGLTLLNISRAENYYWTVYIYVINPSR